MSQVLTVRYLIHEEVPQTPPDDHLDVWNARERINRKTNHFLLNP